MKLNKIKTYNLTELNKEYKEKILKLKQYELDCKSGKEKDSSKIKLYRRDVARILTLINQKNLLVEDEVKSEIKLKKEEKKEEAAKEVKKKTEDENKKESKKVTKKETIKK